MGTQHCSSTWRGAHIWGVLAIPHVPILGVCWGLKDKKSSRAEYDLLKSAGGGWIPKDEGNLREGAEQRKCPKKNICDCERFQVRPVPLPDSGLCLTACILEASSGLAGAGPGTVQPR